jgi:GNAT superfamily N-acetyltransferase
MIDAPLRNEIGPLASAMARGLQGDPGWRHVAPDDDARLAALRVLTGQAIRAAFRDGTVLVARAGAAAVGGIVWAAPGEYPRRWTRQLPALPRLAVLGARIGPATLRELGRLGAAVDNALPDEPVWYVQALSVTPESQGDGLGSALLSHVLAKSDATGVPCYLDTGKASNVGYYRRFGFATLDERALWPDGPVLFRMQRPAAT